MLAVTCALSPVTYLHASTLTESKAASDLSTVQTCNSVSTQGTFAPQQLVSGGATTGSWAFSQVKSTTKNFEVYSSPGAPNQTTWAAGTWTVKINVTAAAGSASMTWADTCILRVNSSGTAQATVGSLTGQAIALNSTGVKTMSITGSSQTASATDRIVVVMNFTNAATSTQSWTLDAGNSTNDTVTAPFGMAYSSAPAETLSPSTSIAALKTLTITPAAESHTAADAAPSTQRALHASDSEIHTATDAAPATQSAMHGAASESNTALDTLANYAAHMGILSETLSAADSPASQRALHATGSETLAFSETASPAIVAAMSLAATGALAETLSPSDTSHVIRGIHVVSTELLAAADNLAPQRALRQRLTEVTPVSAAASRRLDLHTFPAETSRVSDRANRYPAKLQILPVAVVARLWPAPPLRRSFGVPAIARVFPVALPGSTRVVAFAVKDPHSVEDFRLDWTENLAGDAISASSWTVQSGMTKVSDSYTSTAATIRLAGGTLGQSYDVTNQILTASGQTKTYTIRLRIQEQ